MKGEYRKVYQQWQNDPEKFWAEAAEQIDWYQKWDKVLDDSEKPIYRWFKGAKVNTCYNALDRHVEKGRADQLALIYDSPVTGTKKKYTYREMTDQVSRFAGALRELGVEKGDRVILYMPLIPEALFGMLACARLGAVHSVVFGGFAPKELATRIKDTNPKVILSASCGIEVKKVIAYKPLLDEAIEIAGTNPKHCVILQRPQAKAEMTAGRDLDWDELMKTAQPTECVPVDATDPLYVLYTSGTTGIPKGVVRDHGGHLVALMWSMKNLYDAKPGDVYWAASDVGWVVGHSYIVYAPLFYGATTVLYEGKPVGTPDPGAFWRVIEEYGVNILFTAPTAFRAIKRDDPHAEYLKKYNLDHFRTLFLAGERCDPDTLKWAEDILGVPVIDHWWQTETAWPICCNPMGMEHLPIKPGSSAVPVPGYDIHILDETNHDVPRGKTGTIAIKLPLPPGCLPTLWNNDEGYVKSYLEEFPGYYLTGDAGFIDEDGYVWIMSRTDDIINVAGHRLSTGSFEEVIAAHQDVAECAVMGVADQLKGEVPMAAVVLKADVHHRHEDIKAELIQLIRAKIGPVASFKLVSIVDQLPKTRSGKVLRGTMKKIADGVEYRMPATIDDPAILDQIRESFALLGYPKQQEPELSEMAVH